jgi:tetratricopeptide (TPR) repeat protein
VIRRATAETWLDARPPVPYNSVRPRTELLTMPWRSILRDDRGFVPAAGSARVPGAGRLVCVWLACVLLTSCAPRLAKIETSAPSDAELSDLVRRGCYTCLTVALEGYQAAGPATRAFEVSLLLACRAKELGLPHDVAIARAREELAPLPAAWAIYLDIVGALPVDPASGDPDAAMAQRQAVRSNAGRVESWQAALRTGPASPILTAYLEMSIACAFLPRGQAEAVSGVLDSSGAVPLLDYRAGICVATHVERLAAARRTDALLVDADYALGQYALQNLEGPDTAEALERFAAARAAFPQSPSIALKTGDLNQLLEDWPAALEAYDASLALVSTHREALLGRTISLSHLARHSEAIASATRIVGLGTWFLGQAYYWRSWNQLHLHDMAAARDDVARAKPLLHEAAVWTLSGLIEWRDGQPKAAEAEFQRALEADPSACDALELLGGVRTHLGAWRGAAGAFGQAEACLGRSVAHRRALLEVRLARSRDDARAAQGIAAHERGIADDERRRAEASLNAGAAWLNAGEREEARAYLERAGTHAGTAAQAEALLGRIQGIK